MTSLALICARGGSKGLPGKNIRPLAGRPLISHAVEHALAVDRIDRVVVSTDCSEIAAVARDAGADVPFIRPRELSCDTSAEWLVWRHALAFEKASASEFPDVLLVVPVTAPLRQVQDLDSCLDEYGKGDVDVVITTTDPHRNPYFNMVKTAPDGTVGPVISLDRSVARRQDAPAVYDMTTVAYVVNPEFVMQQDGLFAGRVRCVHVPRERALDIDTLFDFKIAECLFGQNEDK